MYFCALSVTKGMMVKMYNIDEKTYETLNKIRKNWSDGFSGTGIIVYDSNVLKNTHYCDLRPNIKCPKNLKLGEERLVKYITEIGDYNHTLHDGFHMVDQNGELTHVAQYFVPDINHDIYPNQKHGTRIHCSILSSLVEGVILVGALTLDKNIYIFKDGKPLKIEGGNEENIK